MAEDKQKDEKENLLERPETVRLIYIVLIVVCVLTALIDFVYHRHAHFGFEKTHTFYALFGFVASIGLILAAKQLHNILKREEDYYDR
jgi:hypothetical protein